MEFSTTVQTEISMCVLSSVDNIRNKPQHVLISFVCSCVLLILYKSLSGMYVCLYIYVNY